MITKLKSWKQITIRQYLDIISLDINDYADNIAFQCDKISILYDIPIEEIEELSFDALQDLDNLPFLKKLPTSVSLMEGYYLKSFTRLSLGEFIDLQHYISDVQNVPFMLAILVRKGIINDFENVTLEPYEYTLQQRKDLFENQYMGDMYSIYADFINFNNNILDKYSDLFITSNDDQDEEIDIQDEEIKAEIEAEKKHSMFAWDKLIYNLTDGNLAYYKEIINLPFILILNTISMKKSGIV